MSRTMKIINQENNKTYEWCWKVINNRSKKKKEIKIPCSMHSIEEKFVATRSEKENGIETGNGTVCRTIVPRRLLKRFTTACPPIY